MSEARVQMRDGCWAVELHIVDVSVKMVFEESAANDRIRRDRSGKTWNDMGD